MKRNLEPYDNIVEVVGWTPLVRLRRIARGIRTPLYGKAENLNPGGSVKDRIGLSIIEGAERRGRAQAGRGDRRGHEREHRHRPRDRRRDQGIPLHLHDPRQDVEREDPPAPRLRGRGHRRADRGAARTTPSTTSRRRRRSWRRRPGPSSRTSTTTRTTRRRTTARRDRRSGSRRRGRSRTSSARPGPAERSPGVGRYLKEKNPAVKVVAGDPVGSIYTRVRAHPREGARAVRTRWRASAGTRSRPRSTSTWSTSG